MFNNRLKNRPPDYIFFLNKIYGVLGNMMASYSYDDKGGLFTEASIIKFSQSVYITRVAETLKSIYLKKGITISIDDLRDTFNKFHVDTIFTKRDYINPDQPFDFKNLFLDGFNFLTEKCKQITKKDLVQGFDEVEFKKRMYSPFLSIYDVSRGKKDVLGSQLLHNKTNKENFDKFLEVCREHKGLQASEAIFCSFRTKFEGFILEWNYVSKIQTEFNNMLSDVINDFEIQSIQKQEQAPKNKNRRRLKNL